MTGCRSAPLRSYFILAGTVNLDQCFNKQSEFEAFRAAIAALGSFGKISNTSTLLFIEPHEDH